MSSGLHQLRVPGASKSPSQPKTAPNVHSKADFDKLERKLLRQISKTNRSFDLIEADDHVMVAISGGKDSWGLLTLLRVYRKKLPFDFRITAVNLDQQQPGFEVERLRAYLEAEGFDYRLLSKDTYSVVKANVPEGKAYCSLCSRLRRGILYDAAVELGATKIALGHHRDDVLETLMLNMFFAGQLKAMPCKLVSDDARNVLIRPLAHCAEADLARYAAYKGFPILPCDLCGSQEGLKRKRVKEMLAELEGEIPDVRASMMAALGNVKASHLYDKDLRGPTRNSERPGAHPGRSENDAGVSATPNLGRLAIKTRSWSPRWGASFCNCLKTLRSDRNR